MLGEMDVFHLRPCNVDKSISGFQQNHCIKSTYEEMTKLNISFLTRLMDYEVVMNVCQIPEFIILSDLHHWCLFVKA